MAKFEKQLFKQKKFFGMTLLHAHLNISILLMQSIRNLQQKLWYKLISLYMHKQNPYLKANRKKNGSFQKAVILSKNIFLASNFFMQMFNESKLCRQSIELFWHKLWYKLNSPHMHYLYTSYKIAKLWISSHFAKMYFFWHDTSSCTCSIYLLRIDC